LGVALLALAASACATREAPVRRPSADDLALRSEAESQIRRGCYTCLRSALSSWETLVRRGVPDAAFEWTKAAILVGLREKELGLEPTTALVDARREVDALNVDDPTRAELIWALEIAENAPLLVEGVSKETLAAAARRPREPKPRPAGVDESNPYVIALELGNVCLAAAREREPGAARARLDPLVSATKAPSDLTPLARFAVARCPIIQGRNTILTSVLADVPDFHEARYLLGVWYVANRRLVSAEAEFLEAANGLPRMAAAWSMLGSTRLAGEEFDMAAGDFRRALSVVPDQREAMLGLARALNFAGRFEEALVPGRRLLDLGQWFVHDANYHVAFAELHLGRLEDADTHAREAQRTNPEDGDTARLVGLVAFRRDELPRAREQFGKALGRNANDCESRIHLGLIHAREARWDHSAVAFLESRSCYETLEAAITRRFAEVDSSNLSTARKESFRARLTARRESARRSQAASWMGAAEAETQRGRFDAAIEYSDLAGAHADFAPRATELKRRILAQPKPAR
jgi:tetratricopeptide (TPR) repeat protein